MNKKFNSIDGFSPRRQPVRKKVVSNVSTRKVASSPDYYKPKAQPKRSVVMGDAQKQVVSKSVAELANRELRRKKDDARVDQYDVDLESFFEKPLAEKDKKSTKRPKIRKTKKRLALRIILILALVIGAVGYYYISKVLRATGNVFTGNIFDIVKTEPLKEDSEGRTNFLIFGTESNDMHSQHGGPLLTDSLMMVSFNNRTNKTSMISIPRDLWVKLEKTCIWGNRAKINVVYQCGSDNGQDEKAGAETLGRKMTEILGLEMHYYMHLSFAAVEQIVDAVGGVEVVIESPDPRGIYDPGMDWMCDDKCNMVKYKNGPTGLMDGRHTLALMRARNAEGGYGLPRSNYDREDNQRKVFAALSQKMIKEGVFTDVNKMLKIVESLGDNLRTNITISELRSTAVMMKKISSQFSDSSMNSISLVEVTKTGQMDGQSVVLPRGGFENYTDVKAYVKKQILSEDFLKEEPTVTVLNGTDQTGIAQKLADQMTELGLTVSKVANAPDNISGVGKIYQKIGTEKPKSLDYIKSKWKFSSDASDQAKYSDYATDFVIVIGSDFELK